MFGSPWKIGSRGTSSASFCPCQPCQLVSCSTATLIIAHRGVRPADDLAIATAMPTDVTQIPLYLLLSSGQGPLRKMPRRPTPPFPRIFSSTRGNAMPVLWGPWPVAGCRLLKGCLQDLQGCAVVIALPLESFCLNAEAGCQDIFGCPPLAEVIIIGEGEQDQSKIA